MIARVGRLFFDEWGEDDGRYVLRRSLELNFNLKRGAAVKYHERGFRVQSLLIL